MIIDPEGQDVKVRLHWMLPGVDDEEIRTAFAAFGKVTAVKHERWQVQGMTDKASTTRTVLLKMKPGVTIEDIPHQVSVAGELPMVVVPCRPMQCLRCRGTGHVWRDCKIPRCTKCTRFGHGDANCVRTYASVTVAAVDEEKAEKQMDAAEAEEVSKGAEETDKAAVATVSSPSSAEDTGTPSDQGEKPEPPASTAIKMAEDGGSVGASKTEVPQPVCEEDMDDSDSRLVAISAPVKRHEPARKEKANETAASGEEPPAKTVHARRPDFKPRPNFSAERRVAASSPVRQGPGDRPDDPGFKESV
ncbi:uncharacterized protein LOC144133322 [Amblyomma americanum]